MKNGNRKPKATKALVVSMYAVGFVTQLVFSNIAEAENFGAGVSTTPSYNITTNNWANSWDGTGTDTREYIVFHDVNFYVVDRKNVNGKDLVTLWSYDTSLSISAYNSGGSRGSNVNKAYSNSDLKTAMDNLYSTKFASDSRIQQVTLGGETIYSKPISYEEKDTTDTIKSYVWAASYTEVMNNGVWGFSSDETTAVAQRAIDYSSWLRSPDPSVSDYHAFEVMRYGGFSGDNICFACLLRPALQILNQTSYVFTTNVTIPTDLVFTANGSGTATNYALNGSVAKPIFTPNSGVNLDGSKIGITTEDKIEGTYVTKGLLTTNDGTTWDAINTGDNANISYMAQVSSNELDLKNVTAGTDYNLKIFGLKTADTTVTELADNVVQGLSIGADGKIHMKVSGTVNAWVPVTASNGAVVDFGGGALTAKLDFKSGGNLVVNSQLNFDTNGCVKQEIGSKVEVPVYVIESDTNVAGKAMFTGVDSTADLNVASGNLTIDGPVTDGQYYVLVAGEAVADGTVKAADLWKKEKIAMDTSNYFLADYDYVTSDNTIGVKVQAATAEEVNTSGLAAVQQGALAVSKEFTGEVENHLGCINKPSLKGDKAKVREVTSTAKDGYTVETVEQGNANEVMPVQVVEKDKYDKEVWASYIRTKETTEGMKLEGIEGNNTAQYNGAVVGVDFYSSDKAIAGLAISYTTGDIDSYSNATFTRNKSKYYGVSFYDRVTNGNTALIYDIGYIRGDNDINQYYNGKDTTSDVKTGTYTAGVRYEAEFGTEKSRVVPFASFRYMRQNNKDYTNSHNTRFEAKNQNLYIPKVGIAWTGDFAMPQCEWTWRPSVEVGYLWNLGDRSADSNVLVGTRIADIGYDIADRNSLYGKAGMEFMCKNFTAGVFYRCLKGNAVKNNKWNVNMSWKF